MNMSPQCVGPRTLQSDITSNSGGFRSSRSSKENDLTSFAAHSFDGKSLTDRRTEGNSWGSDRFDFCQQVWVFVPDACKSRVGITSLLVTGKMGLWNRRVQS